MKKFTLIADPRVKDDLKEAKNYLNEKRKGFGTKFLLEYREALTHLEENPFFQLRYNSIHYLPLKTFKYMIHFQINEKERVVYIFAVLSTHLNPKKHYKS